MDSTATLQIAELKKQIQMIEYSEKNKIIILEQEKNKNKLNNRIDINLQSLQELISKSSSNDYLSSRNITFAHIELSNCLTKIHTILSLIIKELTIIKETNV